MCKYVIQKGDKKGTNCNVKGQGKYGGYCRRHYERNNKDNNNIDESIFIESTVKNNVNNITNLSKDPYPDIIKKYKPEKINLLENVNQEKSDEPSNLYMKYKEGCEIKQKEPIDYEDFDDEEYLKEVANDIEELHKPKLDKEFIQNSLFQLNLVAFSLVEKGSTILKDSYPDKDITDLKGLTKDVYDEEKLYKEVLFEIYKEHSDFIDDYLTPLTTYLMLSVKSIGMRYLENKKKT